MSNACERASLIKYCGEHQVCASQVQWKRHGLAVWYLYYMTETSLIVVGLPSRRSLSPIFPRHQGLG